MNKPYVLFAEDNETDILLMQRIFRLKLQEFDCLFYSNVTDCINFLENSFKQQQLPNLMLIDIKLINSNGLDLLKFVKKDIRFKNIPAIILSSSGREDDKMKAMKFKCDKYCEKPKNYVDFKIKIPQLVEHWSK